MQNGTPSPISATALPDQGHRDQKIVLPGQTPEGQYVLSVLLKRSYAIVPGGRCTRAQRDQKLIAGDVHYGDPMNSTVKFEADFVPFKVATDMVLHGTAYAPGGTATDMMTASLAVGQFQKDIVVIGDRVCHYRQGQDPVFTDPEPFTTMELRYERAYGGVDIYSDPKVPCLYARNHLGRGFVIANTQRTIESLALPNLEDPDHLLTPERLCAGHFMHWERQPLPQGFGWYAKLWQPRAALAGVLPADRTAERELRQIYARAVPPAQRHLYAQTQLPAMDFRFFNGASPGLAVPFLGGDEEIRLLGLTPDGELTLQLPGERPHIGLDIGLGLTTSPVVLHTVMIRLEELQIDLVWRSAVPYPGPDWLPEMKRMDVLIA